MQQPGMMYIPSIIPDSSTGTIDSNVSQQLPEAVEVQERPSKTLEGYLYETLDRTLQRIKDESVKFQPDVNERLLPYLQNMQALMESIRGHGADRQAILVALIAYKNELIQLSKDKQIGWVHKSIFNDYYSAHLVCLDNYIDTLEREDGLTDKAVIHAMGYTNGLLTAKVWYQFKDAMLESIDSLVQRLRALPVTHFRIVESIRSLEYKKKEIAAYTCDLNNDRHVHPEIFLELENASLLHDVAFLLNLLNPEGIFGWSKEVLNKEEYELLSNATESFFSEMVAMDDAAKAQMLRKRKVISAYEDYRSSAEIRQAREAEIEKRRLFDIQYRGIMREA